MKQVSHFFKAAGDFFRQPVFDVIKNGLETITFLGKS